ncbi:hypothetical protein KSF73_05780 [Burkholderiaceae bacterium DAT-1]|nr:hypothetical protein [Burkholderiaceae bacterium DAT-1]
MNLKQYFFIPFVLLASIATWGETTNEFSDKDRISIYFQIIQRLIGPDDTYDGRLHPKTLYINRNLSDISDDDRAYIKESQKMANWLPDQPIPTPSETPPPPPSFLFSRNPIDKISPDIEAQLSTLLKAANIHFRFISSFSDAPFKKKTHAVAGRGAVISFSTLESKNDEVITCGEIYIARLAAGTFYYIFRFENGQWLLKQSISGPVA